MVPTATKVSEAAYGAVCCLGVGRLLALQLHTVGMIPFFWSRGQLSKRMLFFFTCTYGCTYGYQNKIIQGICC